jgi:prolyl oligopeptidase
MGALVTQHPEQFRAVVAMVGIYDVPRHETAFANGPYNVSEYGSVKDPAIAKAMRAYSPLYNVKKGTNYPSVLLTTGANDPRVAPWQSRKFAASLQDASTSGNPVLLLTRMNAGHGIGAPFSQRVGNAALSMTFFANELGLGE